MITSSGWNDQKFELPICWDLLGELVTVAHPHYYDGVAFHFPYESRPDSKAYIPFDKARVQNYFSAHFFGGMHTEVLTAVKTMHEWTLQSP